MSRFSYMIDCTFAFLRARGLEHTRIDAVVSALVALLNPPQAISRVRQAVLRECIDETALKLPLVSRPQENRGVGDAVIDSIAILGLVGINKHKMLQACGLGRPLDNGKDLTDKVIDGVGIETICVGPKQFL